MGLLHDVDKHVADRSVKEVLAEDREAVESVGEKLVALMLGCEHWERFFPDLYLGSGWFRVTKPLHLAP